jgi:FtsP/CotA-like multicopper oxidase with cupredoxin domain
MILDAWFVWLWLALAAVSTAYVAWDNFVGKNPEMKVMRWGWVLITLYMGPVGLALYVLTDKEPRPGEHEEFIRPLWKQGVGSTVHCVAGDATGIIFSAAIVTSLGLPMWLDFVIEYASGFAVGLFVFQSLFMRSMAGGSYTRALRQTFLAEWLSMNTMAAGMFYVMAVLMMGRDMRSMNATEPQFWFVMSVGVIVGFFTAYPVNVWMVAQGLKHGLMTEREPRAIAGASEHGEHRRDVTRPQIVSVAVLTILALVVALVIPANRVNLTLSAEDVGESIMAPGMIMPDDTPGDAMFSMAAVDPRFVSYRAPADARGNRPLEPRMDGDTKVYDLTVSVIRWNILDDQTVHAFAFNRQVPGPLIRVRQGDKVRIDVTNELREETTVHWHGLILPNRMDGPGHITQDPIRPGDTFTYEFRVMQEGTFFYHSHTEPDRQQALGMYGALIVDPADEASDDAYDYDQDVVVLLQEWLEREGYTYPAMLMEGALPNFFTINGKAFPETERIRMKVGERVRVRFIGSSNNFIHPMHIHGGPFEIVETDGYPVPPGARLTKDTVNVGPGERYDVIWEARRPGKWLLHCHIPHHTENNNVEEEGGGGLTQIIEVRDA